MGTLILVVMGVLGVAMFISIPKRVKHRERVLVRNKDYVRRNRRNR